MGFSECLHHIKVITRHRKYRPISIICVKRLNNGCIAQHNYAGSLLFVQIFTFSIILILIFVIVLVVSCIMHTVTIILILLSFTTYQLT